jgi:ABC-type oligopeptide transport system substrate-binding subunit
LGRRLSISLAVLAIGVGLLVAAGFASPASSNASKIAGKGAVGGTLRVDLTSDFDFIDPALDYYSHGWQLQYATTCKLLNFPDKEASAGGTRISPDAAAALPAVSKNGKTYTFTVKSGLKFADGSAVGAANFAYAFNRDLQPKMSSPSTTFIEDIVGAKDVEAGKAATASGIKVRGNKISITLTHVAPDFLARITMPFFSAVRTDTPINPDGIQAPAKGVSCGPYYVSDWTQKRTATLSRNTFYKGSRPHNPDQIVYNIGIPTASEELRVISDDTDLGGFPTADAAKIRDQYGVNKPHTGSTPSFYVRHQATFWYLNLNREGNLFKNNDTLARAVNYAIDRPQMVRQHGALGGVRTSHILPVGFPGYKAGDVYPLAGSNYTFANKLASGHTKGGACDFWTFNTSFGPTVAQVVQYNLSKIGLNCQITPLDRVVETTKAGLRGTQFDILLNGWGQDYPDPYDFINILISGDSILPDNNVNLSYFNEPKWNALMTAASRMQGQARLNAYAKLDHDMMKNAAPIAPYIDTNARIFASKNVGCYVYSQVYGSILNALCVK